MAKKQVWELKTSIIQNDDLENNKQNEYMNTTETKYKLKLIGILGFKYTKKETILVSQP